MKTVPQGSTLSEIISSVMIREEKKKNEKRENKCCNNSFWQIATMLLTRQVVL